MGIDYSKAGWARDNYQYSPSRAASGVGFPQNMVRLCDLELACCYIHVCAHGWMDDSGYLSLRDFFAKDKGCFNKHRIQICKTQVQIMEWQLHGK